MFTDARGRFVDHPNVLVAMPRTSWWLDRSNFYLRARVEEFRIRHSLFGRGWNTYCLGSISNVTKSTGIDRLRD